MSADGGWSLRLVSEPLAWETSAVRCFTGLHVLLGTVCKLLKPSRNRVPTANLASEHKADFLCDRHGAEPSGPLEVATKDVSGGQQNEGSGFTWGWGCCGPGVLPELLMSAAHHLRPSCPGSAVGAEGRVLPPRLPRCCCSWQEAETPSAGRTPRAAGRLPTPFFFSQTKILTLGRIPGTTV